QRADLGRIGNGRGLRHRESDQRRALVGTGGNADVRGDVDRHTGVHGAGAGRGGPEHRSPGGPLLVRVPGIRAARRPAAVRGDMVWRGLLVYSAAFVGIALLAKAAIATIGLPEWVFPASLAVMVLGFPAILFTAFVQRTVRRAVTVTPALAAGGSPMPQSTMA